MTQLVHFRPCDMIFLLCSLLFSVVSFDSMRLDQRFFHKQKKQDSGPVVAINCGSLVPTLREICRPPLYKTTVQPAVKSPASTIFMVTRHIRCRQLQTWFDKKG